MRHLPRPRATLLALALAVALAACSSGDDASSATTTSAPDSVKPTDDVDLADVEFVDSTGQADVAIQVRDNTFYAPYVELDAGTTVTFTNKGRNKHNVYPVVDGAFTPIEMTELEPGESVTLTLDDAGDVAYYCTLHGTTTKGMVGAFRVAG